MPAPRLRTLALTGLAALSASTALADVKVGIVHSLTGPPAFIGVPYVEGLILGLEDLNRANILGEGKKITYVSQDDAGDRGQAMGVLSRYAADPEIKIVLGTTTGSISPTTAAAANDLQIPLLTLSGTDAVAQAAPWALAVTQPPRATVPEMARYGADVLGVKSCAVFTVMESEAYIAMAKYFEEAARAKGVTFTGTEAIKQTDIDFSASSAKVASSDVDCVFISTPAPVAANIVLQLRQAGLDPDVKILGHTALSSPDLVKMGGGAVEGVYLLSEFPPGGRDEAGQAFAKAFEAKHGKTADNWSALGYATAQVLGAALQKAGDNPSREALRDALNATKDVPVLVGNGTFNYTADRFPTMGMNVLQVQDGAFVLAKE